MAKKEKPASEAGSRQLYEMNTEETIAMLNEKSKDYREKNSKSDAEDFFADFSDDDLFNLFFGFDFVYKSDYAVKSKLSEKLEDIESANHLYEASYLEMQKRLGSELYGPEYFMNM
jgi:lipocalin